MIKMVIWDFDGVLVDSVELNNLYFKNQFEKYGKKYPGKFVVHHSLKEIYDFFMLEKPFCEKSFEEFFKEESLGVLKLGFSNKNINQSAIPLLKKSKELGLKNVIATNSTKERLNNLLKACELDSYFDYLLAACDIEKPKPNPEMIFTILKKMDVKPEEAVFIEDSKKGVYAGVAKKLLSDTDKKLRKLEREIQIAKFNDKFRNR